MGKSFERHERRGYRSNNRNDGDGGYNRNYNEGGGNGERRERKPLVWNDKARFTSGSIVGVITEAVLDSGEARRSFKIGREVPDRDGGDARLMPHIGERDLPDFQKVGGDIVKWFAENGSKAD